MQTPTFSWTCRDRILAPCRRPLLMGILNVTPDSFSDGGRFADHDRAIAHGLQMLKDGADLIDVGGESTRPGAATVSPDEEMKRIIPVIEALCRTAGAVVSVDTMKAPVAQAAMEAGACVINDVSALTHDPDMKHVAKRYGAGVVLMHMRGTPQTMQKEPHYTDVVGEVSAYLGDRVRTLSGEGLRLGTLAIDPGIGFGKTMEHNLELLSQLEVLAELGLPLVVGVSRKSFIGKITGCEVDQRLAGSLAALSFCALKGAGVLRVHDVKESKQAAEIIAALATRQGT